MTVVLVLWRYVVFGDAVVATAILDRLLHHSHVITIPGDSNRLREKRRTGLLKAPVIAEHASTGMTGSLPRWVQSLAATLAIPRFAPLGRRSRRAPRCPELTVGRGTEGSNPAPSSGESAANLTFGGESHRTVGISPAAAPL